MKKCLGWVIVGMLLVGTVGCSYNRHTNMGDTEKWVASDVNIVPKVLGVFPLAIFDSIVSPATMAGDLIFRDEQYSPKHTYLSYASSRTVGRSEMGLGYQILASIFTIPIDTAFLPITGIIDLVTVLVVGDDGSES